MPPVAICPKCQDTIMATLPGGENACPKCDLPLFMQPLQTKADAIRQRVGQPVTQGIFGSRPLCPRCGGDDVQPQPTGGYLCRQCDLGKPKREEKLRGNVASENGCQIIKIGRKGVRKFQYDEDYPVIELDVILANDRWRTLDKQSRTQPSEVEVNGRKVQAFVVPDDKLEEYNLTAHAFVCDLLQLPPSAREGVSMAEVWHCLKLIGDEAEALFPFFLPKSANVAGSSGTSEGTELTFST